MKRIGILLSIVKNNPMLSIVLVVMLIGRIAIAGQGCLDDSDEVDYFCSENAYDALKHLDFVKFSEQISNQEGKPTETFGKVFLVPLHRLWAWIMQTPVHSPRGLLFWGGVNIFVSIGLLILFYSLQIKLGFEKRLAILGVMLLGVFVNLNIYTRHLLPYDIALFLQLLSLFFLLKDGGNDKQKFALSGFTSALGFTAHYGCFMFVPILLGFIVLENGYQLRNLWPKAKVFVLYFLLPIIFFEALYRLSGNSYIEKAIIRSDTMRQGSYSDGFTYAWYYLSMVEGYLGVVVLPLFFFGFLLAIKNVFKSKVSKLLLLSMIGYLSFGFMVYVVEKFVFYGRVFHMYYPFIVLGVVYVFSELNLSRLKGLYFFLLMVLGIQYGYNIQSMNSFTYPRKVIYDFGLIVKDSVRSDLNFVSELGYSENYINSSEFRNDATPTHQIVQGKFDVVNTCFFSHFPDEFMLGYKPYSNKNGKVVFSQLHFMSYPVYTFEYCSIEGRRFYLEHRFKIQIVKQF